MAYKGNKKGDFQRKEVKEFEEEVIEIARVTKVVKGGRKLRFRATVAIGNKKNRVGLGMGKSHEVTGAIQKAIARAKKNMITVLLDGSTIPHDVYIKFKTSKILLMPAAPGTGIIAGGSIRKLLELAGVKDILGKALGTNNKVCNAKATIELLKLLKATPVMEKKRLSNEKKAEAARAASQPKPQPKKEAPKVEQKKPSPVPAQKPAPKVEPKKD